MCITMPSLYASAGDPSSQAYTSHYPLSQLHSLLVADFLVELFASLLFSIERVLL